MVGDAAAGATDLAILLSGDSDYAVPVQLTQLLGVKVLLARIPARRSDELAGLADYVVDLNLRDFRRNLLPDPVLTAQGRPIECPFSWLPLAGKIARLSPTNQRVANDLLVATPSGRERHLHPLVDALRQSEGGRP